MSSQAIDYGDRYYVNLEARPPKHSFIHPLDMVGASSNSSSQNESMPSQTTSPLSHAPKLSPAQQLYASAMRSNNPPVHNVVESAPSPPVFDPTRQSTASRTERQPRRSTFQWQPSAISSAAAPQLDARRSSTLPFGGTAMSGRKEIRHVATTVQAPKPQKGSSQPTEVRAPSPTRLIAQGKVQPVLPSGAGQGFPTQSTAGTPVQANKPTQVAAPAVQAYVANPPPNRPSSLQVPAQVNAGQTALQAPQILHAVSKPSMLSGLGKKVGKAAAKLGVGNAGSTTQGIDVNALSNALAGYMDPAAVQAILEARPNANYAPALALLVLQQQQAVQPLPAEVYPVLIAQIQQLQILSLQPQQQLPILPGAMVNNAAPGIQQPHIAPSQVITITQNSQMHSLPSPPLSPGFPSSQSPTSSGHPPSVSGPQTSQQNQYLVNIPQNHGHQSPPPPPGAQRIPQIQSSTPPPSRCPPHSQQSSFEIPPTYTAVFGNQGFAPTPQPSTTTQLQPPPITTQQLLANQQQILQLQQVQGHQHQQHVGTIAQAVVEAQTQTLSANTAAPPPAPASGMLTDLMTSFLNQSMAGTAATEPTGGVAEGATGFSGILSSLGVSTETTVGSVDLSGLAGALGGIDLGSILGSADE